jgi:OmpA-OmpF porin, OOP family
LWLLPLRSEASIVLDSIMADLQRYPGAAIRVAAHVDGQGDGDQARSFEQAKAVKQYLADKLGNNYQWVAIGYGHSRPLVDKNAADRQRNRRIEITLDPP